MLMKWSKLKHEIELRFCDSMKNRLAIYSTTYGNCSCGHAWIKLDKEIIVNFCTRAFWNTKPIWDSKKSKFITGTKEMTDNGKYDELLNNYGELSRQDVYQSFWEYLHETSIEEALLSESPLIQFLAVVDYRVGKRRLAKINKESCHPLVNKILEERLKNHQS